MPDVTIADTAEYTVIENRDVPGVVETRVIPKAGSLMANRQAVEARAKAALAANQAFLAIATPTNAQTVAQVQRLTRECSALIRFLLGDFADVSDT